MKSLNIIITDSEIEEMKYYNEINYVLIINNDDVTRDLINEVNKVLIAEMNLLHDVIKIMK